MDPFASLSRPDEPRDPATASPGTLPRTAAAFAHASEAELARILDFYAVAWEYEPHTFPILFDRAGAVLESFSPDFYLPELDLYVELTTLKQRLVRKKNRKLRRLRELYPGIRIKLLYARDFRALLFKYGRMALADALSGPEGQTTPPRDRLAAVASTPLPDGPPPDLTGPDEPAGPGAGMTGPGPAREPGAVPPTGAAPSLVVRHAGGADASGTRRRSRRTRSEARARAQARAAATEVSA